MTPAATSTTMKPTINASAVASLRESASGETPSVMVMSAPTVGIHA